MNGNVIDFDPADPGICRIWGVSYTGDFILGGDVNAAEAVISTECYTLSENFVTVIRSIPDGGTVSTSDGDTTLAITVGDGIADVVSFTNENSSNSNYAYVITDENNMILGLPAGSFQDFEGAGTGICRVWGLAYTGEIIATAGQDAAAVELTDDCFDLSDNFIEITRTEGFTDDDGSESAFGGTDEEASIISMLNLAPNPVIDVLQVSYEIEFVQTALSQIQIFSMTWRVLYNNQWATVLGTNTYEVNTDQLAAGLYIVKLQHGQEVKFVKFIKQTN